MRRRLALEPLEARQLLTATVAPWPVPQKLTLSFAPDGTQIGLYESDLFATLGDHGQASAWQTEVLRAVQSWANVADLDVGVVPDSGHAFGAVGLAQGDPRFGDIRIAAFPQSRVLANAVPYRSTAGSWSGDIFLNSNFSNSATGVGISTPGIDLYSVLLNEAGNALGLQDNDDPTSAMYTEYAGARTGLAAQDVDAIRQLYGSRRPDAWEGLVGNDTQQTATVAPMDTSGLTSERVTFDGELSHSGDVDYYRIPPIDAGSHVIRFSASGRSLLVGELSVLDPLGNTVASTQATSPLANDLELRVARGRPGESLVVRVKAANVDEFAVGRYRLTIGGPLGGPEAAPGAGTWSIDHYFSALGFLDSEAGENETRETATPLATPFGYAPNSRYEALGAIRTAGDVDLYRLTSPAGEGEMLVHLDTLGVRPIDLLVTVVDSSGRVIATTTIDAADGTRPIVVSQTDAESEYWVRLEPAGPGNSDLGNYVLVVDFSVSDPRLISIGSGALSASEPQATLLTHVARTQLYRFDLSAGALPDGCETPLRFSIKAEDGAVLVDSQIEAGSSASYYLWLSTGGYAFRLAAVDPARLEANHLTYQLSAASLSDDTGPGFIDPTEAPLAGDVDVNGVVNRADLAALAAHFGSYTAALPWEGDIDDDGDVDLTDLAALVRNLGRFLLPTSTGATSTGSSPSGSPAAPDPAPVAAPVDAPTAVTTASIPGDELKQTVRRSRIARVLRQPHDASLSATERLSSIRPLPAHPGTDSLEGTLAHSDVLDRPEKLRSRRV